MCGRRKHAGRSGVPALQKNLFELEQESALLASRPAARERFRGSDSLGGAAAGSRGGGGGGGGGGVFMSGGFESADARRALAGAELLAGKNFDASKLHRQICELELRARAADDGREYGGGGYLGGEGFEGGDQERDLDSALAERTELVVVSAIEGAIDDALDDAEALAVSRRVDAWAREKEEILEQMGLKALEWGDAAVTRESRRPQAWSRDHDMGEASHQQLASAARPHAHAAPPEDVFVSCVPPPRHVRDLRRARTTRPFALLEAREIRDAS